MPSGIKIMDHNYTNFMTMNSNPCNVTIIMIIQVFRERKKWRERGTSSLIFPSLFGPRKTIQIIKPLRAPTVS